MQRSKASERSIVWLLVALLAGACFGGGFVQGLPCESDEDCGPELSCVEGLCGGLGDPALCGNGLRDVGEECDDGNTADGDECTPQCQLPVCGDGYLGPGEECDDGNTEDGDECTASCQWPGVCGNGELELGEECDDGNTEEGDECTPVCLLPVCGDGFLGLPEQEECDDGNTEDGDECTASCQWPGVCGNGELEPGEACDDGNTAAYDACTPVCMLPVCGDGYVAAGEVCDDGNDIGTDECTPSCALPACGDGFVNDAAEACDDGNTAEGDECTPVCSLPECGDGYVAPGEACDDGNEVDTDDCTTLCASAACGDGHAHDGMEECDGDDLAGGTCEGLGLDFFGGTLACGVGCSYDDSQCLGVPVLDLSLLQIKRFDFSWAPVHGAAYYQLEQSIAPGEPFVQLGGDIVGVSVSHQMPLHFRWQASYRLQACNGLGDCTVSAVVDVMGSLVDAVGYVKASNTDADDQLGSSVALSGDGNTLAIGAWYEDSSASGVDPGPAAENDDSVPEAGAVYVFVRDGMGTWSHQAYVKASNTDAGDRFGGSVALSGDGNTLAVGASYEDSNATGVEPGPAAEADDSAAQAGAVYVFVRDVMGTWSQQAYVKASNTGDIDWFGGDELGHSVALSGDGNTLAVGAYLEDSNATGVDPGPAAEADESAPDAGAVYVFVRDGTGTWSQQAYVKASNTDPSDWFGHSVALSGDGNALAVGAYGEDSSDTGVNPRPAAGDDNFYGNAGAVYVFVRNGVGTWSQQAYVKASNTNANDWFGWSVSLSGDGNTLAVGAAGERSLDSGIGGYQWDNSAPSAGAVYVFVRNGMGTWSQQAYVKASNTNANDSFGQSVALSEDGNTLAVGAPGEDSNATGIGGVEVNNWVTDSGAVYVFVRDGMSTWSQKAYVKAPNTGEDDQFGGSVALSGDGNTLAIGADHEDSNATGIIVGDQTNDDANDAGAVYLY